MKLMVSSNEPWGKRNRRLGSLRPATDAEVLRAAVSALRSMARARAGTVGELQLDGLADVLTSEVKRLEAKERDNG